MNTVYEQKKFITFPFLTPWPSEAKEILHICTVTVRSSRVGRGGRTLGDYPAVVSSDGTVFAVPRVQVETFCELDLSQFPYDQQQCKLTIGSWTYDGSKASFLCVGWGWVTEGG